MIVDPAILTGDLFHLCGPILANGAIIEPGNYGRVLRRWGWFHNAALREHALEEWRKANTPELPSRLSSAYIFLSKDDGIAFRGELKIGRQANGFEGHMIYRVRLLEPHKAHHLTHYNLVAPHGPPEHWPRIYWQPYNEAALATLTDEDRVRRAGAGGSGYELLTLSRLFVQERFDGV